MSAEDSRKKQELEQLLLDAGKKADQYESLSNELGKYARLTKDVVVPMREAVSSLPTTALSSEYLSQGIEVLQLWHRHGPDVNALRTNVSSFAANTLSAASTSTGIVSDMLGGSVLLAPGQIEIIKKAATKLQSTLDRFPLVEETKNSMKRLNLDRPVGSNRSPLELLNEACVALDRPTAGDGSPLHVLISLRECINASFGDLLRRRPNQESASKPCDKVTSIGKQCGRPDIDPNYFASIAATADARIKGLSNAKQGEMTREQLKETFNNTLVFWNAFLSGLDETRLKP